MFDDGLGTCGVGHSSKLNDRCPNRINGVGDCTGIEFSLYT